MQLEAERGGGGWEDEFLCQHGVECTVGMGVSMLPLYEGRVPCSTEIIKQLTLWLFLRTLGLDSKQKKH